MNYVTIPKKLIYEKMLGDKRIIIYSYLCSRRALDDTVAFSISEIVEWSKLKPNYREGKINHKYLDILHTLSLDGYFDSCPDFRKLKNIHSNSNEYYKVKLNVKKFDMLDSFGIIYFDELQKILNYKEELKNRNINPSRISSAYMLLLLSYLRVNMNRNPAKPLCCYRLYKTITEDTGLSERYISRIVEILDAMNIVKYQEGRRIRYQTKDNKHVFLTAPKVFADYKHYTKDGQGNAILDKSYNYKSEIQRQIVILEKNQIQK